MSFQSLVSGADCAVDANPLSQVLKHTEGDRTLQQDRIAGPSGSRLHQLPGTSTLPANEHDLAMARQFFQPAGPGFAPGPTFQAPRFAPTIMNPAVSEPWVLEQQQFVGGASQSQVSQRMAQSSWAAEFGNANQQPEVANSHGPQHSEYVQRSFNPGMGMYGSTMQFSPYNFMQPSLQNNSQLQMNGKGKSREVDFDAAFAEISASLQRDVEGSSKIVEVQDDGQPVEKESGEEALANQLWGEIQSEIPPGEENLAQWEAEFQKLMNSEREDDFDYASAMKSAWENGVGNYEDYEVNTQAQFDSDGFPLLDEYTFDTTNKHLDPSTSSSSPLKDAKALLEQNGSLSEAALLLEAAIQKGDLGEGGYEAWILLGETRSMDEHEELGMKALTQGVKIAEAANAGGAGMLSLAISFTNESYDRASYSTLLRWFRARFPSEVVPEETANAVSNSAMWDSHGRITELFINLARKQHSQGIIDPDVQIALGILFYTNNEYDRAKDCFESALSMRPKDYLLWNRLGSALSNGSKPEEALAAYREALQLRPTYTRAIYNVGVACLNIGTYKEAAEHLLHALSLQESTGVTSDQLWFTLRRALSAMERQDLADMAKGETKLNLDIFRREGFDF